MTILYQYALFVCTATAAESFKSEIPNTEISIIVFIEQDIQRHSLAVEMKSKHLSKEKCGEDNEPKPGCSKEKDYYNEASECTYTNSCNKRRMSSCGENVNAGLYGDENKQNPSIYDGPDFGNLRRSNSKGDLTDLLKSSLNSYPEGHMDSSKGWRLIDKFETTSYSILLSNLDSISKRDAAVYATLQAGSSNASNNDSLPPNILVSHSFMQRYLFVKIKQDYDALKEACVISELASIEVKAHDKAGFWTQEKEEIKIEDFKMTVSTIINIKFCTEYAHILTTFYLALHFMRKPLLLTGSEFCGQESFSFSNMILRNISANNDSGLKEYCEFDAENICIYFIKNYFSFKNENTVELIVIGMRKNACLSDVILMPKKCLEIESEQFILIYLYITTGDLVGYIQYKGSLVDDLVQRSKIAIVK